MSYQVTIEKTALKDLKKLDKQAAVRILKFLHERVAVLDDPRAIGEALTGSRLGDLWKYRVGDYRLICDIQDGKLIVLVLRVGHRREVYKG